MADRLALDHVALSADGPTLALRIGGGQSLAVVGRAAAGKSRFLSMLAHPELALRGAVHRTGTISTCGFAEFARRVKPQTLATASGAASNERAAQALSAVGLWQQRQTPVTELTPGQRIGAMLLPALVSRTDLVLIDGLLDSLDPWTLYDVLALIQQRLSEGQTICIATNRPDVAARSDVLVVLDRLHIRFAGSPADLLRSATVSRLEVHTEGPEAVRALSRPFEVTITENEDGVLMEAAEGQQLAAKLLLEGYGDVRFVVLRQPSVESALRALL